MRTTIIAELGSSPYPAWDFEPWCAAAANAGADAVKVQLFRADHFPESERPAKRPLEFPRGRLREFVQCAHAYGLTAGASVFDLEAVALAAEWCDWLKLAAREQENDVLFDACLKTGKPLYRSVSEFGNASIFENQTALYAIQKYPAPIVLSCLRVFRFKRYMEDYSWGWSSHTTGTLDCVLAARLGAVVLEKHFSMSPSDCEAPHSLQPAQFAAMCRSIRKGEKYAN